MTNSDSLPNASVCSPSAFARNCEPGTDNSVLAKLYPVPPPGAFPVSGFAPAADSVAVAKIVTAILGSTHREAEDFTVTIPAALLAQQKRTQSIFTYVMVAIAALSLLVGGIGIMNIVLATVMERTREIGIRRAIGARRVDIRRQFLIESIVISVSGGLLGVAFGMFLAWAIATVAEWKTIVTTASVLVAFGVSVLVGVVFGIYPAMKAASIDPIEALRYE